ncbi:helix-turn-helix transcriptional regulator [Microbacterium indicum]|uniref:helix-turn-helix transcriptional regulator n=1 Tax=Microbacterium indicum TaxID=358100 RepID=UPI00041F8089|nr:helix-turn-helix transcriptional regulator [Microbacterium indicum]
MDLSAEIRSFLMSRRARITPEMAGLHHVAGSRRVAGLRRVEAAMLAGVSVEYYTRMERGKLGGASEGVLDAIARVLQLDGDERAHLFDLVRHAGASPLSRREPTAAPRVGDAVHAVLDSMNVPAVVIDDRLFVHAANEMGRALYRPMLDRAEGRPNFALFGYLDPEARGFYRDLEDAWDLTAAVLRSAAGRAPGDPEIAGLLARLSPLPEFQERWDRHDVKRHAQGVKKLRHPVVGDLDLEYSDFALPGDPRLSLTSYTAPAGSRTADGLALLGSWARTQPLPRVRAEQSAAG